MPVPDVETTRLLNVYLPLVGLGLAALIGAIWAFKVLRDLRGDSADDDAVAPKDLFSPLHEAFESGQMSEEEYARIRQSLEAAGGNLGLIPPMPRRPAARKQNAEGTTAPPATGETAEGEPAPGGES